MPRPTPTTRRRAHSAAVYRRRRLALIIGLAAVVAVVVWLLIAQPWRGLAFAAAPKPTPSASASTPPATPSPTPTPTPTAESTPDPTPTPDATGTAKPCVGSSVLVEALTDADTYAPGQNPQLSIRLTNEGDVDCTLNVGTTTQVFTITSGNDVWWRSTDCQTEPSDMIVTLTAGQTVTSATPLAWDRTRSSVATCGTGDREAAPGGGASYHVMVEIGGIQATSSKQILLY
jgi:hypothetical protein